MDLKGKARHNNVSKAKRGEPLYSDTRMKDEKRIEIGSRKLCAAILATGKTHGPCDIDAAIEYAYGAKVVML